MEGESRMVSFWKNLMAPDDVFDEEEEEEAEQLEEMRAPFVTSWVVGPDGVRVNGMVCLDDGIIRLMNRCVFDDCVICFKPSSTNGKHQICCLPCGHTYGFSCIKKWLLQSPSSGKCPQCKTLCSFQDARVLYPPPRLCVTDHQKASLAAFFPFTKQGYRDFKKYEISRSNDAVLLLHNDTEHMNIVGEKQYHLGDRMDEMVRVEDICSRWAERLEGRADAEGLVDRLRGQASLLKPRIEALERRTDALGRLVSALRRRIDALEQRYDAFESRKMLFKEHLKSEKQKQKRERALTRTQR